MIDHIVSPRSKKEIRSFVNVIKKYFGLEEEYHVNVVVIFEDFLQIIFEDYKFLIVDKDELENEYAHTDHKNKTMKIRVDVYERALQNNPRDLFTIAHEIGHLFLHQDESFAFCRVDTFIPAYRSAEWQANYFAAEFLMNSKLICNLIIEEVVKKCYVSKQSAEIQLGNARKAFSDNEL